MGLASTAADDEAKRRADRAKRFGIEEDEDAKRRAERASRFGIDEKEIASSLDSALPERSLKRGRGRTEGEGGSGRPGKRQSMDRRGGKQRGERRDDRRDGNAPQKPKSRNVLEDPTEKAKAEARAARFANA
jgi:SAP domain-containing ribonucleoprotein